jgi:hypothetical protein
LPLDSANFVRAFAIDASRSISALISSSAGRLTNSKSSKPATAGSVRRYNSSSTFDFQFLADGGLSQSAFTRQRR